MVVNFFCPAVLLSRVYRRMIVRCCLSAGVDHTLVRSVILLSIVEVYFLFHYSFIRAVGEAIQSKKGEKTKEMCEASHKAKKEVRIEWGQKNSMETRHNT